MHDLSPEQLPSLCFLAIFAELFKVVSGYSYPYLWEARVADFHCVSVEYFPEGFPSGTQMSSKVKKVLPMMVATLLLKGGLYQRIFS